MNSTKLPYINMRLFKRCRAVGRCLLSLFLLCGGTALASESDLFSGQKPNEIYFATDSSVIHEKFQNYLARFGQHLANNPGTLVRIEGHADKRGSNEYNLRLGEHRAQATKAALIRFGALSDQFNVVSFGEEINVDVTDLPRNRRVFLVIQ